VHRNGATVRAVATATVIGVDFAGAMLHLGAMKVRAASLEDRVRLVRGDAAAIPVGTETCDAATIAFGIRNVAEPERALQEIARVLRPGGRLAILEFGQPRVPGVRTVYSWYFRYALPLIGRMVSRHQSAYSYLPASVGTFPPPAEFSRILAATGFSQVRAVPLTFGVVYLFVARKSI
jgi:demethylmenaquinone methyltransferase / 2-methoxy-6-polyprenyl-1,4-benzoquinol methylase